MKNARITLRIAVAVLGGSLLGTTVAASPSHVWSKGMGGSLNEEGLTVAANSGGTIAIAGSFEATTSFGGPDHTSNGSHDMYVASYDENGAYLWSRSAGGDTYLDQGWAVAVDDDGSVVVTGMFGNVANFGGANLTSAGGYDIFFVKYGPDGSHQWSKRFGSTAWDLGHAVAIDEDGSIFLAGGFRGTVSFGGASLEAESNYDGFLAKYDSNGIHQWSRAFHGQNVDYIGSISINAAGEVVVLGTFAATANFGGDDLASAGGLDIVVARYNGSDGSHLFSRSYGGAEDETGEALAVDGDDLFVVGRYAGTAHFDGELLTSEGLEDAFLVKFASDGSNLWNRGFGGEGWDSGKGILVDSGGNVIITGAFEETADFGSGEFVSEGWSDSYLASYDTNGVHLWSVQHGSSLIDSGFGLAAIDSDLIAVGSFSETIDFGGGPITADGSLDIYLLRFEVDTTTGVEPGSPMSGISLSGSPNPFTDSTTLEYVVPVSAPVRVLVHDTSGRLVATLVDEAFLPAGTHTVSWDGESPAAGSMASGVYYVRVLQGGRSTATRVVRVH